MEKCVGWECGGEDGRREQFKGQGVVRSGRENKGERASASESVRDLHANKRGQPLSAAEARQQAEHHLGEAERRRRGGNPAVCRAAKSLCKAGKSVCGSVRQCAAVL